MLFLTCFPSGRPATESEGGQGGLKVLFVKRRLAPGVHEFLPFLTRERRSQPELTALLPTSPVNLNKC